MRFSPAEGGTVMLEKSGEGSKSRVGARYRPRTGALQIQVSDSSVSSVEPSLSASNLRERWRGFHGEPTRGGVREGRQLASEVAVMELTRPGTWTNLKKKRSPEGVVMSLPFRDQDLHILTAALEQTPKNLSLTRMGC